MSLLVDILDIIGPEWGVPIFMVWLTWELYCPFPNHTTKLQQFHNDLTARLERIEVTQISMAEEVAGVDESEVREIHGESGLKTSDLKQGD